MTPQLGLFLSSIAFVGTHFLLSHPLRGPLVRGMGPGPFRILYTVVALVTFGAMIHYYRVIGREPPLWDIGDAGWIAATLLMWLGAILFAGSFVHNPALPGAKPASGPPAGVFRITRHPMMWSFAIWAGVHLAVIGMPKALVFDGAIILLAIGGSAAQDSKKRRLTEDWHDWTAQTGFVPFSRGVANPGLVAFTGGTLLFFAATWLHPLPAGFWRWIG